MRTLRFLKYLHNMTVSFLNPFHEFRVHEKAGEIFEYSFFRGTAPDGSGPYSCIRGFSSVKRSCVYGRYFACVTPIIPVVIACICLLFPFAGMTFSSYVAAVLLVSAATVSGVYRKRNFRVFMNYSTEITAVFPGFHASGAGMVWTAESSIRTDRLSECGIRKQIHFSGEQNSYVNTFKGKVFSLYFGESAIYFYPDFILFEKRGKTDVFQYGNMNVSYDEEPFAENTFDVTDVLTLGKIFLHTRKNGLPDRRFTHNPELNVNIYAVLRISFGRYDIPEIIFSNIEYGYVFAQFLAKKCRVYSQSRYGKYYRFRKIIETYSGMERRKWERERKKRFDFFNSSSFLNKNSALTDAEEALSVLGLNESASQDEIRTAFRQLAKKYHPDRTGSKNDHEIRRIIHAYEILKAGQ